MLTVRTSNRGITIRLLPLRTTVQYAQVEGELVFEKPPNWDSSATVELQLQPGNSVTIFSNIEQTITPASFGVSRDGIVNSSGAAGDGPSAKFKVLFTINANVKPGTYEYTINPVQVDSSNSLQGLLQGAFITVIVAEAEAITQERQTSTQTNKSTQSNSDLLSISKIFPRTVAGVVSKERGQGPEVLLRCPVGKVLKINTLSLVVHNFGSFDVLIRLNDVSIAYIYGNLQSPFVQGLQGLYQPGAYLNFQERVARQIIINKNEPIYLTSGQFIDGWPTGTYEGIARFSYLCSYEELEF